MLWTELESSNIKRVAYDGQDSLYVEFHSGKTYYYGGIDIYQVRELLEAPSPGAFLHEIRRGLPYSQVELQSFTVTRRILCTLEQTWNVEAPDAATAEGMVDSEFAQGTDRIWTFMVSERMTQGGGETFEAVPGTAVADGSIEKMRQDEAAITLVRQMAQHPTDDDPLNDVTTLSELLEMAREIFPQ